MSPHLTRRQALYGLGASLGSVAFSAMLAGESGLARAADDPMARRVAADPLGVRDPHHAPRAKACIMIFLEGGPSHIDTFDPKPKLDALHMQEFQRDDQFASAMASGKRYYIASPFGFARHGESGIWMSDRFEHLPRVADELCLYHGCTAESVNHPTACYHMNTGNRFGGDPAIGSWATYGLGTENQDLPAFVVLPEASFPQGGAANWSNGYLPAHFQGTTLRPTGSPILDLSPPPGVTRAMQRQNLDLLAELNRRDAAAHPHEDALAARMASYELAFRMQTEVPAVLNLDGESQATLDDYGIGLPGTDDVARKCLLARKLVESGVRFVQAYVQGWDSHDYIDRSHSNRIAAIDRPVAALIADLRTRGLLDDTLVVLTGEFGRSPDNGVRGGAKAAGRDHNANAMVVAMAGGGVRAGHHIGATDEIGDRAVDVVRPIKDLHVTLLHLLGLDDANLTFFHEGRFKQLSQVGGSVISELLA